MSEPDPNILVDLTTCSTAFEAEVIRDALEQSGIPAFAATTVGAMNPWEVASSMPLRVQVRRTDLDLARRELATIRKEAGGIDWSMQDLGEPEEGELAAQQPGDGDWKKHHEERKTVAKTAIGLASMIAFGPIAIASLLIGMIAGAKGKKSE
jgi:hypothetical protein